MVFDKAQAEINPPARTTGKNAPLGPLREGGRPQAGGERTVRWAGIFRAQTGEKSCRGEHCSPVPACLTRQLSRKMRCGGKWAGDQWSPLHTQQGKMCPSPPTTKNVGADSISARARLRQDKLPRAHIECPPTDFVFNIGLAGSGRYNKKRVCDILDVTDSWCAVQDSNL